MPAVPDFDRATGWISNYHAVLRAGDALHLAVCARLNAHLCTADASQAYADLMVESSAAGKAIGKADGYIAATAAARGLMVATRDTSPFEAAGLNIINPWEAAQ